MSKHLIARLSKYIFTILIVTIFSLITFSKSFSEENVFIIDNVKVEGAIDVNFSRDKYINKAFLNSFKILMSKILLAKDFNKISNIELNKVKKYILLKRKQQSFIKYIKQNHFIKIYVIIYHRVL